MKGAPSQYVNLYAAEFHPPRWPEGLRRLGRQLLLLGALVCLLVLLLLAHRGWLQWQQQQATAQMQQASQQLLQQQQRLKPVPLDTSLQQAVTALESELEHERLRIAFLRQPPITHTSSFSPLLDPLGEYREADLWLTRVQLMDGGNHYVLSGRVPDPAVVSRYLQGLGGLESWRGRTFRQIRIERKEGQRWLQFVLDSRDSNTASAKAEHGSDDRPEAAALLNRMLSSGARP